MLRRSAAAEECSQIPSDGTRSRRGGSGVAFRPPSLGVTEGTRNGEAPRSALMIADGAVAALERDLTALKLRLAASKAARARINGGTEVLGSGGTSGNDGIGIGGGGGGGGGGGNSGGVDSDAVTRDTGSITPDSWPQARRLHMTNETRDEVHDRHGRPSQQGHQHQQRRHDGHHDRYHDRHHEEQERRVREGRGNGHVGGQQQARAGRHEEATDALRCQYRRLLSQIEKRQQERLHQDKEMWTRSRRKAVESEANIGRLQEEVAKWKAQAEASVRGYKTILSQAHSAQRERIKQTTELSARAKQVERLLRENESLRRDILEVRHALEETQAELRTLKALGAERAAQASSEATAPPTEDLPRAMPHDPLASAPRVPWRTPPPAMAPSFADVSSVGLPRYQRGASLPAPQHNVALGDRIGGVMHRTARSVPPLVETHEDAETAAHITPGVRDRWIQKWREKMMRRQDTVEMLAPAI